MSKRRDLEHHLTQLQDLRKILDSMKALAYMETRRLAEFLNAQQQTMLTIDKVARDFLNFFPDIQNQQPLNRRAYLLIGSERGFCGDFNEALLRALPDNRDTIIVAIGQKLHAAISDKPNPQHLLNGPDTSDEVDAILSLITDALTELQAKYGAFSIEILYNDNSGNIKTHTLLPPTSLYATPKQRHAYPPHTQLPPRQLMTAIIDRYVFAALNEVLFTSLMAENARRVQHLSSAVHHLDEKSVDLKRRSNELRQEEITEEIEVILLSAS
ncbi:MAG TPA: FoF1 ATP synthase subunit gamma [Spongiibacteraceae bacterium]|nr:FoF1 ATP synthase subunit gamma [Spongiibacteraceae bacterium]